jgi:HTH-type transcriptional regulator/antitoxin HigA
VLVGVGSSASLAATEERPFQPDYAVPPGETIAELLDEVDMTQTELARRLAVSVKHANQIINGAASISAELALGLEKVFGISADFWLNRESHFRADLARRHETQELAGALDWAKRFPLGELKKRGYLSPAGTGPALVADLLRFLGVASPEAWTNPAAAY